MPSSQYALEPPVSSQLPKSVSVGSYRRGVTQSKLICRTTYIHGTFMYVILVPIEARWGATPARYSNHTYATGGLCLLERAKPGP